jgi:CYTH domain-containing protein
MDLPKYARWEHERRFLVRAEDAASLSTAPRWRLIEDRYLSCGRLRLRKLTDADGGAVIFKLTKKYPSGSALSQPIVSVFLSSDEHAAFHALAGADLRKRRFHDEVSGRPFSVDVFEGPLAGLVLCSVETDTRGDLDRVALPRYAGPEVTDDPFYGGGRLCLATASEIERALAIAFPAPA